MNSSSKNTGEKETKTQAQKRKTSKLAITAVVLAVAAFLVWLFYISVRLPHPPGPSRTEIWARNVSGFPGLVALILGIIAIVKIRKSRGMLKGLVKAIAGIILAIMFLGIWLPNQILYDPLSMPPLCGTHLVSLGEAMVIYANEHDGKYPTANRWCDLLLEGDYVEIDQFVCERLVLYWPLVGGRMLVRPVVKRGRCDYAMNPNCEPNSPGDVVLLFESRPGWNQYGGLELLATEQWHGEGSNIAFNHGYVMFIRGQDELAKLKWK